MQGADCGDAPMGSQETLRPSDNRHCVMPKTYYGAGFAHTSTRGLLAAPLGQVTVLSLTRVTARLRAPQ